MKRSPLFLTAGSLLFLSLAFPLPVSARLTASPETLIVGQRVTLTGTHFVSPLSGTESCTGPDANLMNDCNYVTEVLFRRNGFSYKRGTIVPSASNDSQLVFIVPDMPSGTYGVEIWHRYPEKGFESSGGDASIYEIKVVNPTPPSPKPSPTPKISPSPSPSVTMTASAAPAISPATEATATPLPFIAPITKSEQPAAISFWQRMTVSITTWWQKLLHKN